MRSSTPALVAVMAAALALTGCAGDDSGAGNGKTVVDVSMDPGLEKAAIDAFNARVAQFEKANPTIDIVAHEYQWTATTFTAQLAGGTLPDVFTVPFTDGRGLIERKQIADLSDLVAGLPYAKRFNDNVAGAGRDADGRMWAVPIAAHSQALHYNRTLFTQAGLDPNDPPATWGEVRAAARQITERTGQTGYAQMTKDNTGGWALATVDYALGGRLEKVRGDEVTATIDTSQMADALRLLRQLRWDDNSMGANFLYDWGTINQDFAAGRIGMYVSGGGNYGQLVTQNAIKAPDYGVTALPLAEDGRAGVLGGGTLAVVSATAEENVRPAALRWIDFYYMRKLTDPEAAALDAKTAAEADTPVGVPQLPVFDRQTYDEQQTWIADYVNVPLEQFTPYTDAMFDQPLVTEPARSTQEVYAVLDPVVQAVLTDENADIGALLERAEADAQAIIDRG